MRQGEERGEALGEEKEEGGRGMTPEELNQIGIAIFGAIKCSFPEHMVPLQQVFNVLNTHCGDARISIKKCNEMGYIQYEFYRALDESLVDEKPALEEKTDG
jgi:predicted acetyltransferase